MNLGKELSPQDILKAQLEKEATQFLSKFFQWQAEDEKLSTLEKLKLVQRRLQAEIIEFIESELDSGSAEIDGGYGMNSSQRVWWATFTIDTQVVDNLQNQTSLLKQVTIYLKRFDELLK